MPGPVDQAELTFGAVARTVLVGLLCLALGSCGTSSQLSTPTASPPNASSTAAGPAAAATTSRRVQLTLDAVAAAVRTDDRAAFDQRVSTRDPAFARGARRIYDNLSGSPLVALAFRVRSADVALTPGRRELLGPDASVLAVEVTWRLRGDTGPAQQQLWLTFLPAGAGSLLAGTTDGPTDRVAQPLWMLEPIRGEQLGATTVLAGSGAVASTWASRGNQAVAALRPRLPSALRTRWNGELVIEVPSSRALFEQVLGVTPRSYAQIAAVAWPEGPDAATAAIRIVVNPELAVRLDGQGLAILVAHEATHIATRSAASPAPTWLVEGFADFVAYDAYPRTASAAAEALLADVALDGPPSAFPPDSAFSPAAPDLTLTYASSWLACRFLAETYGADRLDRFYVAVDRGASVDEAGRQVFGRSQTQLTGAWGTYLRTAAQRR